MFFVNGQVDVMWHTLFVNDDAMSATTDNRGYAWYMSACGYIPLLSHEVVFTDGQEEDEEEVE